MSDEPLKRYNVTVQKNYRYQHTEEVIATSHKEAVAQVHDTVRDLEVDRKIVGQFLYETEPSDKVHLVSRNRVHIADKASFKELLTFVRRTSVGSHARKSFMNCITTLNAMKRYSYSEYTLTISKDWSPYSLSWYFEKKYLDMKGDSRVKQGMSGGTILHGYKPEDDVVDKLYYTQEQLDKLSWGTHT